MEKATVEMILKNPLSKLEALYRDSRKIAY